MNAIVPLLEKNPAPDPSQDFYQLRREGIGLIQKAGSDQWTDYNVHDPGITILEALCFAITDIGYRLGWPIEDILAPAAPPADPAQPYPNQAFFTAREILTVNPATTRDIRRALIDLASVRDAWIVCKTCACEASYWAFCDLAGQLVLQYPRPASPPSPAKEVWAHGLYEILIELENDPALGDLNDRMVIWQAVQHDADGAHPVLMELRFPDISLLDPGQWRLLLGGDAIAGIDQVRLGATKTFNVYADLATPAEQDAYVRSQWNNVFYLDFRITLGGGGGTIEIRNAGLRVFGDNAVRAEATAKTWLALFTDAGAGGFIERYRKKARAAHTAVAQAKAALQTWRNLDEDYCVVLAVGVEDVAVCADVELKPDADIERVQAEIWFELEQYMNPPVRFRTLQELQDENVPVEDCFNGPELDNGFIEEADLDAAAPRTMLRSSDIIDRLMGIEGVVAVNQLRMTKYDEQGVVVAGAADPAWVSGQPVYDDGKTSAAWLLSIRARHHPRLYLNQSRFLFYKGGLPLKPRMDEATDTLNRLRGDAERPKAPGAPRDLPVPPGSYRHPDAYFPVQYSFPLAYGIGPEGLPLNARPSRVAQARNLKAYLLVFEQLLGNMLAQLAHTADLFSLDPGVTQTYFVKAFDPSIIKDLGDIADTAALTPSAIAALLETPAQAHVRRNLFLDHLLARFGEQFSEYALLLTSAAGEAVAQERLIENKIAFLRRYPEISHDRARAFNYTAPACTAGNAPGIKARIRLLLGHPDLAFTMKAGAASAGKFTVDYSLVDGIGKHWLDGSLSVAAASDAAALQAAYRLLLEQMIRTNAWTIAPGGDGKFTLALHDAAATEIGHAAQPFAVQGEAVPVREALRAWSASERIIVVEHLLLRPRFIGDALYPACCDGPCDTCGNEDPYSFRLTWVMPGWSGPYTDNLDLRRYAERTIQQETPAHLLPKTCWVGNEGVVDNPCDGIVEKLAGLLIAEGKTAGGEPPTGEGACACAKTVHAAFSKAFSDWYADKKFVFLHADALRKGVTQVMQAVPMSVGASCTTVFDAPLWDKVRAIMRDYFVDIGLYGWQFERFEWAWCQWLDANAAIDWTEERLVERVEAILTANLNTPSVTPAQLCDWARGIVTDYGTDFYAWMQGNVAAGNSVEKLTPFPVPAVALEQSMSFTAGTNEKIAALLHDRYASYARPSYWLWAVVTLLANLHNTYPGATLHDCDDGSDRNPVRLGSTALGNYPNRSTS
jgi:hypothetical protein